MSAIVLLGAQWGDEGKGKAVDLLAASTHHVVRAQGGNNAGHTLVVEGNEYRLHLIPSGVIYPHTLCHIAGGVVVDPAVLCEEIEHLKELGVDVEGRLFLAPEAQLILSFHKAEDGRLEALKGTKAVGTTGRGIGPSYADKAHRIGPRVSDILEPNVEAFAAVHGLDQAEVEAECRRYADRLSSYIHPVTPRLHEAIDKKEQILLEGAQGTFLDCTYGTYPFVTSSSTLAGGILAGAGLGPRHIDKVIGIAKAYTTRVGAGPFPTECDPSELGIDLEQAREVGTTTGRPRRVGWFDAQLVRQAVGLNGMDVLFLTKLDILDPLAEIKILTDVGYETLPGWQTPTTQCREWDQLPENARRYVDRIQQLCGIPIEQVFVGPDREQTIVRGA